MNSVLSAPDHGRAIARPPVRMAHLGLGAFHRAHQAWYTELANAATRDPWGYHSFTGRTPDAALALERQHCRYTLVIRDEGEDTPHAIRSIARASDGAQTAALRATLSAPDTALVTLTVTEAGYHVDDRGELDLGSPAVLADLDAVRRRDPGPLTTPVARLVDGLAARRRAGGGPLALVSCDNMHANGDVLRASVVRFAEAADPALARWIEDETSFVSTMVDRITPAVDDRMRDTLTAVLPNDEHAPVVAEPFTEWVLAGEFPAGRPSWEAGGARFVSDVAPFEERKLWLLNAGHSLLAYLGLLRGHTFVSEAMSDPVCLRALEALWDEAQPAIRLPREEVDRARADIRARWRNPRIEHSLRQIGKDGLHKLRIRIAPVVHRWRHEGWGTPEAQLAAIGYWLAAVRDGLCDDRSAPDELHAGDLRDAARAAIAAVSPALSADAASISIVASHASHASPASQAR